MTGIPAPKPFHYKPIKQAFEPRQVNRDEPTAPDENLTKEVQGQPASDLEERFARAISKDQRVKYWEFQPSYIAGRNVPGEIRPDFTVWAVNPTLVFIDGGFTHKTADAKAHDRLTDALLFEHLRGSGYLPPVRIPGERLQTQDDANAAANELITYGRIF